MLDLSASAAADFGGRPNTSPSAVAGPMQWTSTLLSTLANYLSPIPVQPSDRTSKDKGFDPLVRHLNARGIALSAAC